MRWFMPALRSLLCLCLLLPGPAVAASPAQTDHPLVGRWALVNQAAALYIEFHADGTYRARTPGSTVQGRWALVDEEHLATWTTDRRPRRVNRFRVHGDQLVIIDGAGVVHVHRRDIDRPGGLPRP